MKTSGVLTYTVFAIFLLKRTFPEQMKIAKVIPLYKTGDKHLFSKYRAGSLLPNVLPCNILNTTVNMNLKKYLCMTNIKRRCISIKGVNVWNNPEDLRLFKSRVMDKYKTLV